MLGLIFCVKIVILSVVNNPGTHAWTSQDSESSWAQRWLWFAPQICFQYLGKRGQVEYKMAKKKKEKKDFDLYVG